MHKSHLCDANNTSKFNKILNVNFSAIEISWFELAKVLYTCIQDIPVSYQGSEETTKCQNSCSISKNMHTHNQCLFSQCICKRSETVQTWPIRILPSKSSCPALSWDFLMADLSFLLFFCSISLPCCSVEVSLLEAGGVTSPVDWATSLKVWLVSSKDVCWWSDEFRWSELMVDGWDEWDGGWDEGWDEVELVACVLAVEMLGWAEVELALTDLLVEMSLWCFSDPAWFGWTTFWWLDLSDFNFLNNMIYVLKSMPSITQFINNWESRKIPVHWTINQHSITSFSNIYWYH